VTNTDQDRSQERWLDRIKSALGLAEPATAREGIEEALQEPHAEADISPGERALLSNVLAMRDVRVVNVMTPRARIVGISEDSTLAELLAGFRESAHARMPIYGETLDDPKGMVHIRDFLSHLAGNGNFEAASALLTTLVKDAPLLRPVLFVPPSTPALDLLVRMQTKRVHMAIVIDEYGETDGLVTMEDLVEVIVGDIDDEHDTPEPPQVAMLDDHRIAASGEAGLAEVSKTAGIELSGDDAALEVDSIGGFITALAGRVPLAGEKIEGPEGIVFEVVEASPRQVKQLIVHLPSAALPPETGL
jgi:CBS domain containing-hemolysin-like protein